MVLSREGYHLLPKELREERDRKIVELYDAGFTPKGIAYGMRLSYEGTRKILRKNGRMRNRKMKGIG